MAYIHYNPNPLNKSANDCVVRSLCRITGDTWRESFVKICCKGYEFYDMPSTNSIWDIYVMDDLNFEMVSPDRPCCTVKDFTRIHSCGYYLACTGSHVVAIVDGNYYDAWDSGNEIVTYYYRL